MYIKEIKIKNFKSLKKAIIKLKMPDKKTIGSGLNILIGENNAGKSSFFEILRKPSLKLVDKEEINYQAQTRKEEISVTITNNEDKKLGFESRYYTSEDPDNKIYLEPTEFELDLFHANTSRKLEKSTNFTSLPYGAKGGKNEDLETKTDNYQIIQEIHKLTQEQRDQFCKVVNDFLPEIKRVYVKSDRRSDKSQLVCKLNNDVEIDLRDMGSGIEQFIILLWVINFGSIKTLLIDEPEISLHPKAQIKLAELLLEKSKDRQIIIATHSPYIFKNCMNGSSSLFIITKKNNTTITDFNDKKTKKLFPWSPSWGEINYRGYKLATIEFHNELFGFLQERERKFDEKKFDNFLSTKGINKNKDYKKLLRNGKAGNAYKVTLPTYIRNQIHHPENKFNKQYSEKNLNTSVVGLIKLI